MCIAWSTYRSRWRHRVGSRSCHGRSGCWEQPCRCNNHRYQGLQQVPKTAACSADSNRQTDTQREEGGGEIACLLCSFPLLLPLLAAKPATATTTHSRRAVHPSLCGCCSTSHNYPHTHQAVSVHVFNTMHQLNGEAFAVTNSPHRTNKVHVYADVIIARGL